MKKKIRFLLWFAALFCLISLPVMANDGNDNMEEIKSVKILFVGNSFTYYKSDGRNIETPFMELCESAGQKVEITSLTHGLAYLKYYAGDSTKYLSYHKELISELLTGNWDYVVLQEQSMATMTNIDSSTGLAVEKLQQLINRYQPNAEILLYMTHGYQDGTLATVNGVKKYLTINEMQKNISSAYGYLGNKFGLEVVPVGMQFARCGNYYPGINLIGTDWKHPSYAGYYLAACCFYYQIFGELPSGNVETLTGCNLTEEQLQSIESLVYEKIDLSAKNIELKINKSAKLLTSIRNRTTTAIKWKSFDESIAKVNSITGTITAVGEGTTVIMAMTSDGLQASCNVTVRAPLSFGRNYYSMMPGDSIYVKPNSSTDTISWSTSKKSIATVSTSGLVHAVVPGKSTITVKNKTDALDAANYTIYVACRVPTGLKASTTGTPKAGAKYANIRVTWKSVIGATKYDIYRSTKKNGSYQKIGTANKTTYTDKTAGVNCYYFYKVVAGNAYTNCNSELSVSTKAIVLKTPTVKVKKVSKKYAYLSWAKNSKATGYIIYRSTSKNSGFVKVATLASNQKKSYTDKKVKKNKKYYYRVQAYRVIDGKVFYGVKSSVVLYR